MNNKENRIAYYVEFSSKNGVFSSFSEENKEYWTAKTLAKRLNSLKYCVHSARMVVVEDVSIQIVSDE